MCSLERQELLVIKPLKIEHEHTADATSIYLKENSYLKAFCSSCHASVGHRNPFYTDTDQTWLSKEGHETNIEYFSVDFQSNMKSEWTLTASPAVLYLMLFGR